MTNSHEKQDAKIYHLKRGGKMELKQLINRLKILADYFLSNGVEDIYTNSKIYEVLIAEQFGHQIINGHAYTPDARDEKGEFYEYKHYKVSSSNHTWTFNDFTDRTIEKLYYVKEVYFAVINDEYTIPDIEKIFIVPGEEVARYMEEKTQHISNLRKMINISPKQIMSNMAYDIIEMEKTTCSSKLKEIFMTASKIEAITGVEGILTSNKLWELLVAYELNHNVNSEQRKHDAYDELGRTYEYKVSSVPHWTFQDITQNVLDGYLDDEKIVLAVVDKKGFSVERICFCNPNAIVSILQCKLQDRINCKKTIRRISSYIGMSDVRRMIDGGDAEWVL